MAPTISLDQYRALHESAGFIVRGDRGRIALRGADRKGYLQGLLSNDVLGLTPGAWCYATMLTAQGRMISDMRVFDLGDLILLDLEAAVAPLIAEHLERFVIAEDVVVENVTASWEQIGVYGPDASAVVRTITDHGAVPLFVLPSGDVGIEGVDLIVPADRVSATLQALERAEAVRVDRSTIEVTRIEAGIPRFLVDMDPTTIPLEAGIEDRAISMTKGCYVGQEVIVRVLHRGGGRVAKKLVTLAIDDGAGRPGDHIYAAQRDVGRITSVADSPRAGQQIALAYVQRDFTETGTELTIRTATGESRAIVSSFR